MTRSYRRLDVDLIQCTNQKLCARIQERFPTANLVRVCQELSDLVDSLKAKADWIGSSGIPVEAPTCSILRATPKP